MGNTKCNSCIDGMCMMKVENANPLWNISGCANFIKKSNEGLENVYNPENQ